MLPRLIIHNGVSVDGRMDWFSGDIGLYYELAAQMNADAMLSGSNTMLAAFSAEKGATPENEETAEPLPGDFPEPTLLLVVVDSRGRLQHLHQMRRTPYWRDTIVLCSRATPQTHLTYLQEHQLDFIVAGAERVDLRAALAELKARFGINVMRIDSGGVLNGVLLREGLVDEVSLLVNPYLVGGTTPRSIFTAPDLTSMERVIPLKLTHLKNVRDDIVWLRYEVGGYNQPRHL
jgi:2,5-diamino-6-(ribosylamino)-4(3H)-pyrimidinone 5'-phosphate reductase